VIRTVLVLIVLLSPWYLKSWASFLVAFFIADIIHGVAGGAFVWPAGAIHPLRSLISAFWAYGETVLGFAVLYRHFDCLTVKPLCATQALYFSAVTATTVGYGDIVPDGLMGQRLVVTQIAVSVFFAVLFINSFMSRVGLSQDRVVAEQAD
jgi:hypothetical protein